MLGELLKGKRFAPLLLGVDPYPFTKTLKEKMAVPSCESVFIHRRSKLAFTSNAPNCFSDYLILMFLKTHFVSDLTVDLSY